MRKLACILSLVCIHVFSAATSSARIITVDDDAPADFATIQAAIDDANDGDTVFEPCRLFRAH